MFDGAGVIFLKGLVVRDAVDSKPPKETVADQNFHRLSGWRRTRLGTVLYLEGDRVKAISTMALWCLARLVRSTYCTLPELRACEVKAEVG